MARSKAWLAASLRYFSSALTALSITLTTMSRGLVVLVDRAVHEGHALVDAAGQLALEVGQAVVADAAAEAHHRRLADVRALGQLGHRQRREAARVGQQQLGDTLLGRRQGGDRGRMRSSITRLTRAAAPGRSQARPDPLGGSTHVPMGRGALTAPRPRRSRRARRARSRRPGPRCRRRRAAGRCCRRVQASQDRLDPAPGLLLLVAAHEQVELAGDRVEQQALVAADAVLREGLVEVEVEEHRRQRVALARALGGQQVQLQAVFRLQLDDQLVRLVQRPGRCCAAWAGS